MAEKPIITQTPPNAVGAPQVFFRENDFNVAIYQHGYKIISERAVQCPCADDGISPRVDCQNCGGTGWVYIEPRECNALITGINVNTEYKEWSPELLGTIAVSVEDSQREVISYYNRITLTEDRSIFSEALPVREYAGGYYVFTTYAPIDIYECYIYQGPTLPLLKLEKGSYSISKTNPYVVNFDFTKTLPLNLMVTVDYKHRLEYHIIDIPHEVRSSRKMSRGGKLEQIKMPIQGIARRSHLITGIKPNVDGTGVIVNK